MIMKNIFALAEPLSLVPAPTYGSQPCVAPALGDPTLASDLRHQAHKCADIPTLIKDILKNYVIFIFGVNVCSVQEGLRYNKAGLLFSSARLFGPGLVLSTPDNSVCNNNCLLYQGVGQL